MTMLIVTHEMGFARAVADRIVFMDRGNPRNRKSRMNFCGTAKRTGQAVFGAVFAIKTGKGSGNL